jgi:integrase
MQLPYIKPRALYDILQRWCDKAGIPRRKFHALRHSSALDAIDEGISIDKVQKQLGHSSIQTTMRYLRGRDPDRARAYREHSLSKRLKRENKKTASRVASWGRHDIIKRKDRYLDVSTTDS